MLKKFVVPVAVAGVLLGGALSAGTASATTPTTAASAAAVPATKGHLDARAWLRAHRRRLRREGVVISAKTIGVTPKDLVTELRTGKSVADVAGEHGVSAQTVVNALVTAADARVDKAVTSNKVTSAQATTIKAKLPTVVSKAVNHVFK